MNDEHVRIITENFVRTKKLYHYTSFESACKIIASQTLRFGRLGNMNDINEAYKYIFSDEEAKLSIELAKYRQQSFTMDGTITPLGFNISSMWGHYATKGTGVCFVFNQNKLLQGLSHNVKKGNIKYTNSFNSDIILPKSLSIQSFLEEQSDVLFFQKTQDWAYEQEFRLLVQVSNDTQNFLLPITDSLIAAILYYPSNMKKCDDTSSSSPSAFNSLEYKILFTLAPNLPILALGHWDGKTILVDKDGGQIFPKAEKITLDV